MALGKRQEARGKSEEGLGDFTFRYILLFEKPLRVYGFFPFTYLIEKIIIPCSLFPIPYSLFPIPYIGKRFISLLQPITTIAEPFSKRLVGSGLMINLLS